MEDKKVLYTVFSVLALIFVIIGMVFAFRSWSEENKKEQEKISLKNY